MSSAPTGPPGWPVWSSNQSTFPNGNGFGSLSPSVPGFDQTFNSGTFGDAFVTQLASNGESLLYATYLGGNRLDSVNGLALDQDGNVYVTGGTLSNEATFPNGQGFASLAPSVPGADPTYNDGAIGDGFAVKLSTAVPTATPTPNGTVTITPTPSITSTPTATPTSTLNLLPGGFTPTPTSTSNLLPGGLTPTATATATATRDGDLDANRHGYVDANAIYHHRRQA